jgi:hypothetical protein
LTNDDPRDARYREWRERHEHYLAAIAAAGGRPWTTDEDERRALWWRRWQRPDPPAGLGIPDIRTANREITQRWIAAGWVPPSPRRLSSTAPKSTEFAVMRYSVSSPPARATIHRGA